MFIRTESAEDGTGGIEEVGVIDLGQFESLLLAHTGCLAELYGVTDDGEWGTLLVLFVTLVAGAAAAFLALFTGAAAFLALFTRDTAFLALFTGAAAFLALFTGDTAFLALFTFRFLAVTAAIIAFTFAFVVLDELSVAGVVAMLALLAQDWQLNVAYAGDVDGTTRGVTTGAQHQGAVLIGVAIPGPDPGLGNSPEQRKAASVAARKLSLVRLASLRPRARQACSASQKGTLLVITVNSPHGCGGQWRSEDEQESLLLLELLHLTDSLLELLHLTGSLLELLHRSDSLLLLELLHLTGSLLLLLELLHLTGSLLELLHLTGSLLELHLTGSLLELHLMGLLVELQLLPDSLFRHVYRIGFSLTAPAPPQYGLLITLISMTCLPLHNSKLL